ncbi:hypothetical protein B0I35DRAFT_157334 [Stachybotrys elegans]|uniref:Uncharacterized protein n=1 Tax=Stachybotrys elegans TaxID=80388 RepID=A0A8K0WTZ4_9HYPO|nr:hypothetical protein B0I35DRAFT_157334 [Stachybotrys elegans]
MFFRTTLLALAASSAFAAPPTSRSSQDISVELTGEGVPTWKAIGFRADRAGEVTSERNPGPFSQVKIFFSDSIKKEYPGIENEYRCALEDSEGNRIIVTRGNNIDFNFGDNGNPNAWTLRDGPFHDVKIKCNPEFKKISPLEVNTIRVNLLDEETGLARHVVFDAHLISNHIAAHAIGKFRTVQLVLGPGVDNQKFRCQLTGPHGEVVLVDRGNNKNKETFGDGNKGPWKLDAAGDGIAEVNKVTCDPRFE